MKKRVLTKILSLALAIALIASMAVPVFADTWGITFLVGGQPIENGKSYTKSDLPGILERGTIELKDNVLTLNNVIINVTTEDDGILIANNVDTTINLIGENEITVADGGYEAIALFTPNDEDVPLSDTPVKFTIQGASGSFLGLYGDLAGIGADPVLQISNCDFAAFGNTFGIMVRDLIIDNSNVIAFGLYTGICARGGNIDVRSGSLIASSDSDDYYSVAVLAVEDYDAKDNLTGGKILLGSDLEIKIGGSIVSFIDSYDVGDFNAQTIAEARVKSESYGYAGAAKAVVIGEKDAAGTTTQPTDTTQPGNTAVPSIPKFSSITGSGTPKANASAVNIAATGENTAILLVAAAVVVSIGAITFTLRKKAK